MAASPGARVAWPVMVLTAPAGGQLRQRARSSVCSWNGEKIEGQGNEWNQLLSIRRDCGQAAAALRAVSHAEMRYPTCGRGLPRCHKHDRGDGCRVWLARAGGGDTDLGNGGVRKQLVSGCVGFRAVHAPGWLLDSM